MHWCLLVDFVPVNLYCHVPVPLQFASNKFFNQSINQYHVSIMVSITSWSATCPLPTQFLAVTAFLVVIGFSIVSLSASQCDIVGVLPCMCLLVMCRWCSVVAAEWMRPCALAHVHDINPLIAFSALQSRTAYRQSQRGGEGKTRDRLIDENSAAGRLRRYTEQSSATCPSLQGLKVATLQKKATGM